MHLTIREWTGDDRELPALSALGELDDARRAYELLPQFPAEPGIWAQARAMLDQVSQVVTRAASDIRADPSPQSRAQIARDFDLAKAAADAALAQLGRYNLEQGALAARGGATTGISGPF